MRVHTTEKKLAVLIASLEDGLSFREIEAVHSIHRNITRRWLKEHFSGKVTLEWLKSSGKTPTEPVGSKDLVHARIRDVSLSRDSIRRRKVLKEGLIDEKRIIIRYLTAIDAAIRIFNEDNLEVVPETENKATLSIVNVDKNEDSIDFTLCNRVSNSEFDCSFCEHPVDVPRKTERVFLVCKMCVSRMESRVARKMLSTIASR